MRTYRVICSDVLEGLRSLPDGSVRCCVTSPPYWGLRDYGHAGQIGLERTPEEYVAKMVEVFREVRRVLAEDGTVWCNLGDSYARTGGAVTTPGATARAGNTLANVSTRNHERAEAIGLKPKDLVGIPWRVAFALQSDGWWLRQDIIWSKPNPMPESVTDRCTKAHEYVFLLSKAARYYYDAEPIREPISANWEYAKGAPMPELGDHRRNDGARGHQAKRVYDTAKGANRRSVWTIATQPFPGAHFAVMPEALVEPCVLAGSAVGDTVLDPFAGSGTVGVVALRHDRHFIGIELNPEYAGMAEERIRMDAPLWNRMSEGGNG